MAETIQADFRQSDFRRRFVGAPQNASKMPWRKYVPFHEQIFVDGVSRTWPDKIVSVAPRWASVDLRDGNQALAEPMDCAKKLEMWNLLLKLGVKEIEVGFPSASETDAEFIRLLIDENLIPDDVTIGVLTQAREHLIKKTYETIKGAKNVIVHLYNSTSILQRKVVFNLEKDEIVKLAVEGAKLCKSLESLIPETNIFYEYSPESFTGTEPDFAAEISNYVAEVFQPTENHKVIINLPSTVEMTTPNVYADAVEWVCSHLGKPTDEFPDDGLVQGRENLSFDRNAIVVSLHPHNDQGMGIASAHLGLQAGADRIEGCIFGNGERTGNVDFIAVALNLFANGVDPELEIHDIKEVKRVFEKCTNLTVPERHPYAGDLVFTAFSGSHQDAIKKGIEALGQADSAQSNASQSNAEQTWQVPYLLIDPRDIGANYESVIRVNSQSGKGGVAYILKNRHNLDLPKRLQIEFSAIIQKHAETSKTEIKDTEIYNMFVDEYLPIEEAYELHGAHFATLNSDGDGTQASSQSQNKSWGRFKILSISDTSQSSISDSILKVKVRDLGEEIELTGVGNGPIDAFINAISPRINCEIQILDYVQHSLTSGQDSSAATYIEFRINNQDLWGVGIDSSTTKASLKAVVSAINRAEKGGIQ